MNTCNHPIAEMCECEEHAHGFVKIMHTGQVIRQMAKILSRLERARNEIKRLNILNNNQPQEHITD